MLNSEIRNKISQLWDMFWAGGMSNPLTALEQISYLLFLKRAEYVGLVNEKNLKWSYYTKKENLDLPVHMKNVFEQLKGLNNDNEPFTKAMQGTTFEISKPSLLKIGIELIDDVYSEAEKERENGQYFQDTLGDFYELILKQTSQAGKNGQFRTPRHIIQLMCEILRPNLEDTICDVTAGTSGFLVGAYQYIITHNSTEDFTIDENGFGRRFSGDLINKSNEKLDKLTSNTFFGYDIDATMIRLGMMNLLMHNIKQPNIKHIDSLSQEFDDLEKDAQYSIILANPPFTGRIDSLSTSLALNRVYPPQYDKDGNRKKQNIQSENLFLERIIQLLKLNGRAAVIVPEGVLFGADKARKAIRKILLQDCCLDAVISLPSGVFQPYTGVKTSILIFTKKGIASNRYNTERVWFYELQNDGYTLDDNRRKLAENPLPLVVESYENGSVPDGRKSYFYVSVEEIEANDFDLSYNRYREFEYTECLYDPPQEILRTLLSLEDEIRIEMNELKELIG